MDEFEQQKKIHEALEEHLSNDPEFEGKVLTGWIMCYEYSDLTQTKSLCGHVYGPREMTTWKALGILEWVRRFSLGPDDVEDEQS